MQFTMELKRMKVEDLDKARAFYNPKKSLRSGDKEYEQLKQSIQEFSLVRPPVYNKRTNTLISGHQTVTALKDLGVDEVDVVVVDLPLEKEKLLNLALNKIQGGWDFDKLADMLSELGKLPDLDETLSGFDTKEIGLIFDRHLDIGGDDFDADAVVDSIDQPITKRGDLIILGNSRLLCGDSASPEDLKLLMGGHKADMVFTDPPYGVAYYQERPTGEARPKKCRRWERIYKDDLTEEEYAAWIEKILINMDQHLANGAPVYIFNAHKQFSAMHSILKRLKYHVSCVITWAKSNFSISYGDYNQQTEFCLYAWKEDNGAHKWYGPTNESTLWEIDRDPTQNYLHLTQKPVALSARAIRNSSRREDAVLELFGGSGSTLIACTQLERRCFCMEISEAYCDSIVRRYIAFVGADNVSQELKGKYLPGGQGHGQK